MQALRCCSCPSTTTHGFEVLSHSKHSVLSGLGSRPCRALGPSSALGSRLGLNAHRAASARLGTRLGSSIVTKHLQRIVAVSARRRVTQQLHCPRRRRWQCRKFAIRWSAIGSSSPSWPLTRPGGCWVIPTFWLVLRAAASCTCMMRVTSLETLLNSLVLRRAPRQLRLQAWSGMHRCA